MAKPKRFEVGDRVRFTGRYLRDTGQVAGGEGHKRWTVQPCTCRMCETGEWIATEDEISGAFFTPEELAKEPYLRLRHINTSNLEQVKR